MNNIIGSIAAKLTLNIDDFTNNLKRAEESIKQTEQKLSGFKDVGNRIAGVGTTLTTAVTLPIVGAGTAATKFFMDFEKGMAKVGTVADTTKVPLNKLGEDVKKLSIQTGMSTSDMQAALYDVISAGVKTEDSIKFLEVAVKSAKGGFTDTATAVDGLTSALNAYGIEASKAGEIANQMMVAQNLGKTTFGEMAAVVGRVAPTFSAANVSTKELFSSFAVLTANGIQTTEAATGLKAALSNIIKPSKEAQDAAEALGIKFDVNEIKTKGWMGFLLQVKDALKNSAPAYLEAANRSAELAAKMQELEKAGKKNSDEYKNLKKEFKDNQKEMELLAQASGSTVSGLATMFGSVEGLNAVLALTSDQGIALYNESMKQMGGNTDLVTQSFNKMSETSEAKLSKALNALKVSMIDFGAILAPVITGIANFLSALAEKINNLDPAMKNVIVVVGAVLAAVGPVLVIVGKLIASVQTISSVMTLASGATAAAGGSIAALAGPIAIAIGAIVGFIAIFTALYKNNEDFRNSVNSAWNAVKTTISTVIEAIKAIIQAFVQLISAIWNKWGNEIKIVVETVFKNVSTIIQTTLNVIKGVIQTVTALIKGDWQGVWNGIKTITTSIWDGIKGIISNTLNGILSLVGNIVNNIKNSFMNAWNSILDGTRNIFNNIKNTIVGIFSNIHIPMPHFNFSVSQKEIAGIKIPVPNVSVNWYDKGGIFYEPSVIGVGEKRPEFVGALDDLKVIVKNAMQEMMPNPNLQGAIIGGLTINGPVYIRNEQDITKLSHSIYNENTKVLRAMGKKDIL